METDLERSIMTLRCDCSPSMKETKSSLEIPPLLEGRGGGGQSYNSKPGRIVGEKCGKQRGISAALKKSISTACNQDTLTLLAAVHRQQ